MFTTENLSVLIPYSFYVHTWFHLHPHINLANVPASKLEIYRAMEIVEL